MQRERLSITLEKARLSTLEQNHIEALLPI